jgi:DegV family protein with EDD domain
MTIRIVTDSTSDISPQTAITEYGISVIPANLIIKGKTYRDGIDISRADFYCSLPDWDPLPTTSVPSMGAYLETYQRLADEGATGILSIHVPHTLSNMVDVARSAAAEFKTIPVRVYDSGQLSLGMGFLSIEAARLAQAGCSFEDIIMALDELAGRTFVIAKLDTLDYLRRGGRLTKVQHSVVSLLDIRPIMKVHSGLVSMSIARTRKGAIHRLVDLVNKLGPAARVGVIHANALEEAENLWEKVKEFSELDVAPMVAEVTPVIGTHVGPGAIGLAWVACQAPSESHSPWTQLTQKVSSFRR